TAMSTAEILEHTTFDPEDLRPKDGGMGLAHSARERAPQVEGHLEGVNVARGFGAGLSEQAAQFASRDRERSREREGLEAEFEGGSEERVSRWSLLDRLAQGACTAIGLGAGKRKLVRLGQRARSQRKIFVTSRG